MKKVFKKIMALCLILLCITSVSCNSHSTSDGRVSQTTDRELPFEPTGTNYSVQMLSGMESEGFDDVPSFMPYLNDTTEIVDKPALTNIKLGKKSIKAYHTEITNSYEVGLVNEYTSEDKNTRYWTRSQGNCFGIYSQNDTVLCKHNGEITEDAVLKTVKNYISSYIDISNIDDYVYECSTYLSVRKPNAAWGETRTGFYVAANDTSEVEEKIDINRYYFDFILYCNGYKTGDGIEVSCEANGDITSFRFYDHQVNWKNFTIDEEKIDNAITQFMSRNLSSGYAISKYDLKSKKLAFVNGKIRLALQYGLSVAREDGSTFAVPCMFYVSAG